MSNFVCPHCGMVNIDCGSEGYKTPREIEFEKLVKELKKENEELKAQRDTYISLMNVYKNISKGRQYNKTVTAYIDKLERRLQIAEEALSYYAELYIDTDICYDQFFGADAVEALQKMKEVSDG